MKKRILGLALALIMIISLLPLTTFAAQVGEVKIYVNGTNYYTDARSSAKTRYFALVDDDSTADTEDKTFKEVAATDPVPTTGYIKVVAKKSGTTLLCDAEINNINTDKLNVGGVLFRIDPYDFACTVNVTLVGTNIITSPNMALIFNGPGDVTITGGSLEFTRTSNAGTECTIQKTSSTGTLTFQDTTVRVLHTANVGGQTNVLRSAGPVVIDNSTVELCANNGSAIRTATHRYNTGDAIKNVDVTVKNNASLKAYNLAGQQAVIYNGTGKLNIENASLEAYVNINATLALKNRPYLTGSFSTAEYNTLSPGDSRFGTSGYGNTKYSLTSTAGEAITSNTRYFKFVHEHVAAEDDHNCMTGAVCACGHVITPGAAAHIAGANADDCTKDTICGNPGCTQVFEAATATAHTPKADDGDCTTDILCANPGCTQVATKGAEKHKDTRTDCAVAGTCANTGCTHTFTAGQHTGGTATCKAKAKCEICSKEYGELAACTPAADDGNCETAIKCSVCGKETTAAKTHKYTDKADTTCDNPGCTNTRKVEGTENPKTGDNTALVLVATLMVAAAAAFVTSKKFVR